MAEILFEGFFGRFGSGTISDGLAHGAVELIAEVRDGLGLRYSGDLAKETLSVLSLLLRLVQKERFRLEIANLVELCIWVFSSIIIFHVDDAALLEVFKV